MNIGLNNNIDSTVVIGDNVTIGNNNIIKKGTVIYKNTIIGDDNVILEDNRIGTLVVEANKKYNELHRNGLIIGNNNFFHIQNIISSGFYEKTIIGDNNCFYSGVYISHDNIIHNDVTFYPRVFSAGIVEYFDNSNIGAGAHIHQRIKIGAFSMIGMNATVTKDVLPYMVSINNKYSRLNTKLIKNPSILKNIETILVKNDIPYEIDIQSLPSHMKKHFEDILCSK